MCFFKWEDLKIERVIVLHALKMYFFMFIFVPILSNQQFSSIMFSLPKTAFFFLSTYCDT